MFVIVCSCLFVFCILIPRTVAWLVSLIALLLMCRLIFVVFGKG